MHLNLCKFTFHYELIITEFTGLGEGIAPIFTFHYELIITHLFLKEKDKRNLLS